MKMKYPGKTTWGTKLTGKMVSWGTKTAKHVKKK
jgi:hypothetical protein